MTDAKPLAVVTGASSGIGRELARQFATNGFDVIVAAEDTGLVAAADDLAATGAQVQPVRADLATFGGVEQLLEAIAARLLPDQARAATHATMTKPEGGMNTCAR